MAAERTRVDWEYLGRLICFSLHANKRDSVKKLYSLLVFIQKMFSESKIIFLLSKKIGFMAVGRYG